MTTAPPQPPDDLALASIFEPATREQWLEQVAGALRKSHRLADDAPAADAEATLLTSLYDGFDVKPLYTQDDALPAERVGVPGAAPFVRGGTAAGSVATGWDVRAYHAHPDPRAAREAVMTDLENGVTSLWLALGPHALPVEALGAVLQDVFLDLAPIALDAGPLTGAAAEALVGVVTERGIDPAQVGGTLGADPIGARARYGRTAEPDTTELVALARRTFDEFPLLRPGLVDATPYHDAGGSDAEELGASIATGLAYLRALTDAGLEIDDAFAQLEFRYAVNADQFSSIAKLRAARRLWSRVAEVCGAGSAAQKQHAVTSTAMMSRRDPWVNMLRTTLAAFGAGVGGADAVTVQPFDAAIGLPDDFSRRMARNTSALLMLESHVARVVDPAGGSYYVERLTDQLAGAAWDWFTEIERAGGIVTALDALVPERLAATWDRRAQNLAHRRDALTGVSEFPLLDEVPVVRATAPHQQKRGEGALPVHRYASEYEALRDAADAHAELTGDRAAVFLATLGPASAFTARSTFAANLFQAGGLATPDSGPETDPQVIAAAFGESRATVACIASSDKVYAEHAAAVASALKTVGAQRVWLAGKPGDRADEWAAAGIDGYVFTGCDALAVLRSAQDDSGVTDAIEEAK